MVWVLGWWLWGHAKTSFDPPPSPLSLFITPIHPLLLTHSHSHTRMTEPPPPKHHKNPGGRGPRQEHGPADAPHIPGAGRRGEVRGVMVGCISLCVWAYEHAYRLYMCAAHAPPPPDPTHRPHTHTHIHTTHCSPLLVMHFQGQRLAATVNAAFAQRFLSGTHSTPAKTQNQVLYSFSFYYDLYFVFIIIYSQQPPFSSSLPPPRTASTTTKHKL